MGLEQLWKDVQVSDKMVVKEMSMLGGQLVSHELHDVDDFRNRDGFLVNFWSSIKKKSF